MFIGWLVSLIVIKMLIGEVTVVYGYLQHQQQALRERMIRERQAALQEMQSRQQQHGGRSLQPPPNPPPYLHEGENSFYSYTKLRSSTMAEFSQLWLSLLKLLSIFFVLSHY